MARWSHLFTRAAVSGTAAALSSTLALALAARAEGKGALQPVNATSHWLHGPRAADVCAADVSHTGIGYATHHAATLFWAALFEAWRVRRPARSLPAIAGGAAATAVVAAAVDYLATPKRFTPGWEYVLSKRSMALVYVALGAGLAIGAMPGRNETRASPA